MRRREFLLTAFSAAGLGGASAPLKIGHRQSSMAVPPGPGVFDLARRIPGLEGVELQLHFKGTTLWDRETARSYQDAAARTGLAVPSLSGVWNAGASILQPARAEECLRRSIQSAEWFKARVILVSSFGKDCPSMDREESYGPVVAMLKGVAPAAASAGVTLALENPLSPADNRKLVDLVAHPAVKVYYDPYNMEYHGHRGQSIPGFELLGTSRVAQVHVKNGKQLLSEPGPVDWSVAIQALRRIRYSGWLVFETAHSSAEQCVEATTKNIEFLRRLMV